MPTASLPTLSQLLDVQELDIAADSLRERLLNLPERAELLENEQQALALDQALAALEQQREALNVSERALGGEVSGVAAKVKEAEDTLYSGTVKAIKELEGLQQEVRVLKEKQAGLEDRELELMEQIETCESEIAQNREQRGVCDACEQRLGSEIAAAEGEIDGELVTIGASRAEAATRVPVNLLEAYAGLRAKPRFGGRAAARLHDGTCQGCRIKLAVIENRRIKNEPFDALVVCSHCRRMLVR